MMTLQSHYRFVKREYSLLELMLKSNDVFVIMVVWFIEWEERNCQEDNPV